MSYKIKFLPEAIEDMKDLDNSLSHQITKGIVKVSQNPLPIQNGGYGKPLGNKDSANLTGLCKIKFRGIGIRVVYSLEKHNDVMTVIIVSVRDDSIVYKEAAKRRIKHDL